MPYPKIKIESQKGRTTIYVNGVKLEGARSVAFSHDASGLPVLNIGMIALDVELDAEWLPNLPEPWDQWYIPNPDIKV